MAWVDPYRHEVWDYLLEVGNEAKELGFDEVQFDYLRFPNEASAGQVVYDDAVIRGRSKTDTILECANYLYENLASQGLFVSADVFRARSSGAEWIPALSARIIRRWRRFSIISVR